MSGHMVANRVGTWVAAAVCVAAAAQSLEARAPVDRAGETAVHQEREFRWSGRIAQGNTVEIKGVNGSISARGTSGDQVEVVAEKRAKRDDPRDVRIEVIEHDAGVTICAVYPSRGRRPNECRPGSGGRNEVKDNDVKVNFTIRVPAGVDFIGRNVNGPVEATSLSGATKAYTVNGGVDVSTSGLAEARSVNGTIHASLGRADWSGELDFSTVNGSITVELPEGVAARVTAATVNGTISSDFPLTVRGKFSPKKLSGTIGDGNGRELNLSTVNGSIWLRKH